MDRKIKVAVIGGGIAGLALTTQLVKLRHLDVHLYESAPQFSEIGAGISFGANAVEAIHLLGLGKEYEAIADKVKAPYTDIWFQWRNGYTDEYLSASVAPNVGQSSVHRADFLDSLIPLVPSSNVHFNKRLHEINATSDQVKITFADGQEIECDFVIGCDGIRSVVRDHVLDSHQLPRVAAQFSGTWAYRGIIKFKDFQQAIKELDNDLELADVPQMLLGKDKHILTFPIRQGEEINIVAFKSDRTQTVLPENTPWTRSVSKQEMLDDFTDWSDSCQALLNLIEAPTLWALHEIHPLKTYKNKTENVIVIGDAAHAMLPHQGAGAGQGLEDALILANLLANQKLTHETIKLVSGIYEQVRLERAVQVQNTSHESGEIYELSSPQYPSFKEIGAHLTHRFDWLWQHSLEQDIETAAASLQQQLQQLAIIAD
ncbi:salicylate 1-monooxygenase [Acinetobacter baumannii]|jgi:salicylate hydroxylase|uniref:salicylate 1-monooxygenase n=2 Tax=Acinetobacter baumannii TaxID=470 RepID=UPI0002BAA91E|nr:salicylate 1-monooxygenase [Acinetobacter baumannii]KCW27467.1 salicylate 1-monooxygenase [Acinetobacter baumannii 6935]EHZ7896968.1 salicylate 1-monooxygenase [Acinetobacter baumannii]EKD3138700.1 salicylate 1-monooxygenase [Acinetobacter baumannii]EKT8006400.1 salicylate 1-monooxygenase [Acinetobacter baumannii]EKT8249394.1 salicylate 1-monooxygenase [Acinetobacter baumannii]